MKLDMSKFKKGDSDGSYTTLHHADGHTLKIATKALSKPMRKELDRIPMADGGQTQQAPPLDPEKVKQFTKGFGGAYANGGETEEPSTPVLGSGRKAYAAGDLVLPFKSESTGTIPEEQLAQATAPQLPPDVSPGQPGGLVGVMQQENAGLNQAAPTTTYKGEASDPDTQPAPAPTAAPDASRVQESLEPSPAPTTHPTVVAPPVPATPKQKFLQEAVHIDNDLAQGHITPQTYQSLFASKDTLGKIGTLFGLLVSGAGAGLAHQQNAVLDMMDKTIDRDLDAQKVSAGNAQNFYKIALQKELQEQGTLPQMQAQTRAIPSEVKLRQSQTAINNAEAQSKMLQLQVTKHFVQGLINKVPPAMQPQAQAAAGALNNAANAKIQQLSDTYQDPGGPILKPEAGDYVNGAAASAEGPLHQMYPELSRAYDSARQAEKGMQSVDAVFPKLSKEANFAEYLQHSLPGLVKGGAAALGVEHGLKGLASGAAGAAGLAEPLAGIIATAGLAGAGASAAGAELNPLKWDVAQKTRLYNAHKTYLTGALTSALAGTNAGAEDVRKAVDSFTPELGDDKATLAEKQAGLKHFIRIHANLGVLERNHLTTPE